MRDKDAVPHLAQLFLDVVLFVLPRDIFQSDRRALMRLCRVRKGIVEDMHACGGGFALDLHVSSRHVVMLSPYPSCHLTCLNKAHFDAFKRTAARFQSIDCLSIDLHNLPRGCNFASTEQILDLVFHCLRIGRAKQLHISHAFFNTPRLTHGLQHLFQSTKDQIVSLHLEYCHLVITSQLLRELSSMRNLQSLALDGNRFELWDPFFPSFGDKLQSLSVTNCRGVRVVLLATVSRTLQSLVWNNNVMLEAEKPFFLAWIAGSRLRGLCVDNCGFTAHDAEDFQVAFARMPCLLSLSIAHNDCFENIILWWMYEYWRCGGVPGSFTLHVSNMHVCFPEHGTPVFLAD
jgi:hypothetical protein